MKRLLPILPFLITAPLNLPLAFVQKNEAALQWVRWSIFFVDLYALILSVYILYHLIRLKFFSKNWWVLSAIFVLLNFNIGFVAVVYFIAYLNGKLVADYFPSIVSIIWIISNTAIFVLAVFTPNFVDSFGATEADKITIEGRHIKETIYIIAAIASIIQCLLASLALLGIKEIKGFW